MGSDPFHAPDPCILYSKPLCTALTVKFCPVSDFAFRDKCFATVHEYVKPLDSDLASSFHTVSLQFPRLLPEFLSSVVIEKSSSGAEVNL